MLSRKLFLVSFLVLMAVVSMLWIGKPGIKNSSTAQSSLTIMEELPALHEGDLIFRKGRSLVSTVVLMNDRASAYSHVGIVSYKNGEPFIVHAVPGEPDENGEDKVKCDAPNDFLNVEKASLFAIYRLAANQNHKAEIAAQKAMEYYEMGLPFDKALNFRSDDRLYCTELVWKAYLAAGINLTGNKFHVLKVNLLTDSVLLPGQFIESKWLTQIYP